MVHVMELHRITVAGAGSIGCFVGGLLAAAGREVILLGRQRVIGELATHGLHLTDFAGPSFDLAADRVGLSIDPAAALARSDLILVAVKSGGTEAIAAEIAEYARPDAIVVSLQNGVENAARLHRALPGRTVIAAMVPFNVVHRGEGRFHRGTSGALTIAAGHPEVEAALSAPGLPIVARADMEAVQWGKLVINLNNALNALSGLTLHEQLGDRRWRVKLAGQQVEALKLLKVAGIAPAAFGPIPLRLFPYLLRLPNWAYRRLAARGIKIDRTARSSMWEDLQRGRPTEIDELQGAVVALAERLGRQAPENARVREQVRAAERASMTPAKDLQVDNPVPGSGVS